jgi:hypothetical protein
MHVHCPSIQFKGKLFIRSTKFKKPAARSKNRKQTKEAARWWVRAPREIHRINLSSRISLNSPFNEFWLATRGLWSVTFEIFYVVTLKINFWHVRSFQVWETSRNLNWKLAVQGLHWQYTVYMHIENTCTYSYREGGSVELERRGEGQ